MTIWISVEHPLIIFERLYMSCTLIGPPCEKLWPFEFLESFHCSILSVSTYYAPESDIRGKSYDHLNFSRTSVVQFRASVYVMRLNWTSEWKVMTIWISRELPLFNFEHLDILCARIWPTCEKLWPFDLSRASVVHFLASLYVMHLNRTSVWKVMTIWISQELPSFNSEHHDILCARIWPPWEKLWPFEFLKSFRCSISSVCILMRLNRTSVGKAMTIWISRELPLFNFECLYIDAPESDIRVKSYDHLNFSRASYV